MQRGVFSSRTPEEQPCINNCPKISLDLQKPAELALCCTFRVFHADGLEMYVIVHKHWREEFYIAWDI